jgi:signal peptidase I
MNEEEIPQVAEKEKSFFSFPRYSLRLLLGGFFLWLIIRAFFFQVMYIPSSSMKGTLQEGDYIIVNKLAYGPRLPMTLFSLPFSGSDLYLDWVEFSYHRAPGYSEVKRNDVIVFNYPEQDGVPVDMKQPYIKRCVALPGDTFSIVDGSVFVNGKKLPDPEWMQKEYAVELKNGTDADLLFKNLGIEITTPSTDKIHFTLLLSKNKLNLLRVSEKVQGWYLMHAEKSNFNVQLFPHDPHYKSNRDFYGPLVIPQKGKTVQLNDTTIFLYRRIIETYEGNTVNVSRDSVFVNKKYCPTYTFKQDYYFVLGDNRYDSEDSRYWGFVPESHLIGKASCLLFASPKSRSFSIIH